MQKIQVRGLDGSEPRTFLKKPKNYRLTTAPRPGSGKDARAGIYRSDAVTTTRYAAGAVIDSIQITECREEEGETQTNRFRI